MAKDTSASKSNSVLVVDDDRVISRLLAHWLKNHGFKAKVLSNGRQAIQNLEDGEPPCLVFLDIIMPYADGFEVLSQMRADKKWKNVPVIMLTSKSSEATIVRAFNAGADDYVTKPFRPAELMVRMNRLLNKKP